MKRTIIQTWCDQTEVHPDTDEPAKEVPVLNSAGKPVKIDLCEPCEKGTTIVEARILGDRFGQPIQKRTRNRRRSQPARGTTN